MNESATTTTPRACELMVSNAGREGGRSSPVTREDLGLKSGKQLTWKRVPQGSRLLLARSDTFDGQRRTCVSGSYSRTGA